MSSERPRRAYRTARERVAMRRGEVRSLRRNRRGCGLLGIGALAAAVALGVLLFVVFRSVTSALQTIEQDDPRYTQSGSLGNDAEASARLPDLLREPFNVLLLGVDRRDDPEEGVRSDTLIVVHVDPREQWAGMLSIPRDSVAAIPQLGQQKINVAYSYGYMHAEDLYGYGIDPSEAGGALAAETVEAFLGISIDYIAQVDFRGFERIVDTIGGVTVDIPRPLLDPEYPTDDFGYERVYIPAGLQVLDGRTALRYARSRHSSNDFDRSRRQQQVLHALLNEVRQRGLFEQAALLPDLARDLEQSVATTLPISDLAVLRGLADIGQSLTSDRIVQLSINPNDVGMLSEHGSDIYWDQDDVAMQVARLLAGPSASAEVARIQVQNGIGVQGLATRVSSYLTQNGFLMASAGDAPHQFEHSLIIDYTGRPLNRQRLADLLGIDPRYIHEQPQTDDPPAPYRTDIVLVLGGDYQERWAGDP